MYAPRGPKQYFEPYKSEVVYGPGRSNLQFDLRTLAGLNVEQMAQKMREWADRNQVTALDLEELQLKIVNSRPGNGPMIDAFYQAFPHLPYRSLTPDPQEQPVESKYTDKRSNLFSTLASCLHSLHTRVSALEGAM